MSAPIHAVRRALAGAAVVTLVGMALVAPCRAQAPETKRSEGRYYVELAEVMLTTSDFDLAVADVRPAGAAAGQPPVRVAAELSSLEPNPPRVTIGLNRTSGKTTISVTAFDFAAKDARIPQDFDAEGDVITTPLLPPGIVFQRQAAPPQTGSNPQNRDDFVPNFGNEYGYIRRYDVRMADFTIEHNVVENKRFRLRWVGGLRYAQILQGIAFRMSFQKERQPNLFGGPDQDIQDFFSLSTKVDTHGTGPKLGLATRTLFGKKKKWSLEASGDISAIPESSAVSYRLSLVDSTPEYVPYPLSSNPPITIAINLPDAPFIPGLSAAELKGRVVGSQAYPGAFFAAVQQDNFSKTTLLGMGQLGFRFKANRTFSIGLDAWGMRWWNLLSQVGVINEVAQHGRYQRIPGIPNSTTPSLREQQDVIHVSRFTQRSAIDFTGLSLNLKFDF